MGYVINTQPSAVTSVERSGTSSASATHTAAQSSLTQLTLTRTVTDHSDGSGNLFGAYGTVLYPTKTVNLKVIGDFTESTYQTAYETADAFSPASGAAGSTSGSQKGGETGSQTFKEVYAANSLVVRYKTGAGVTESHTMTVSPPAVQIDLCPYTADQVVPGSIMFTWMGTVYVDFEGVLYRGRTDTDPGFAAGTIDYESGIATMTDYVASGSPTAFSLDSLWTRNGRHEPIATITFNTALAPIKPTGLVVSVVDVAGNQLIATADLDGNLLASHIYGRIDYESGLVELQFGDFVTAAALSDEARAEWWYDAEDIGDDGRIWRPWPVLPETLRYNAIAYTYLPLDADILGIDPVRLPADGRVPVFRRGGVVLVMHAATTVGTPTLAGGQYQLALGRTRIAWVRVLDATGAPVTDGYTLDQAAGTLAWDSLAGLATPLTVQHTIADLRLATDVQINGTIELSRALTHDFPADDTLVASCLIHGDRRARVSAVWDQQTWVTGTWEDSFTGTPATATLNTVAHPIQVTNEGAETERWLLRWTSTSNVELIGERVGLVYSGAFVADIAPINPRTRGPDGQGGVPYLLIPAAANGGGWITGNVVRINTVGAIADVWIAQSIQQSDSPPGDGADGCELYALGNVDNPIQ